MKKFIYLLCTVLIVSCVRNSESKCETCDGNKSLVQEINVNGKIFTVKRYLKDQNTYGFGYCELAKFDDLQPLFADLETLSLPKLDYENVVVATLYTKSSLVNKKLALEDISGLVFYSKVRKSNQMKVRIFYRNQNGFTESKESNLKTNILMSNDINNLGFILNNGRSFNSICFMISADIPFESRRPSELQQFIDSQSASMGLTGSMSRGCSSPCPGPETPNGCGFINREYRCDEGDELCLTDAEEHNLDDSIEAEQLERINSSLYGFKGSDLAHTEGGAKFVRTYYSLSSHFPLVELTVEYCVRSITMIHDVVIPMGDNLLRDPESERILYNEETAQVLLTFFEDTKRYYRDEESISQIDGIMELIRSCTNKSHKYVYERISIGR